MELLRLVSGNIKFTFDMFFGRIIIKMFLDGDEIVGASGDQKKIDVSSEIGFYLHKGIVSNDLLYLIMNSFQNNRIDIFNITSKGCFIIFILGTKLERLIEKENMLILVNNV